MDSLVAAVALAPDEVLSEHEEELMSVTSMAKDTCAAANKSNLRVFVEGRHLGQTCDLKGNWLWPLNKRSWGDQLLLHSGQIPDGARKLCRMFFEKCNYRHDLYSYILYAKRGREKT